MSLALPNFIDLAQTQNADASLADILASLQDSPAAAIPRAIFFAMTSGRKIPEALALAALALKKAGFPEKAAFLWDFLAGEHTLKTQWIATALQNAIESDHASRWLVLLANMFIAHPTEQLLRVLDARNTPLRGSCGIHRGHFHAWIWLPASETFHMSLSEGAPPLSVSSSRTNYGQDRVLYTLKAPLPATQEPYTISLKAQSGRITNSPVLVSSPECARSKKGKKGAAVTVLIPVYDGRKETLACLASLFASEQHIRTAHRILVVWDHGPDERLLADLRTLAARQKILLLENPVNLGFLGSVNAGLARTASSDVILLNADTLVHGDWLDRMAQAMKKKDLGTVTVLSNNAEILSYPNFHERAAIRKKSLVRDLDCAASKLPPDLALQEIPVGIGFCMGIARRALDACIGLDGRFLFNGYGEEVDFCLRVAQRGLKNYALLSVFVAHTGSCSYGARKKALVAQNNSALFAAYPRYDADYSRFLACDPLCRAKEQITQTWLEARGPIPAIHLRPWAEQFLPRVPPNEAISLTLHARMSLRTDDTRVFLTLAVDGPFATQPLPFSLPEDEERLTALLRTLACTRAIAPPTRFFHALADRLGLACEKPAPFIQAPDVCPDPAQESIYCVFPPLTLADWQKLCDLARILPESLFWVLAYTEIWGQAVAPSNIQPMPTPYRDVLPYPDAVLVPRPSDAVLWSRSLAWIRANMPHLPILHLDALLKRKAASRGPTSTI
ncbi:MAG: glycosyltransferase [Desulfovibrionaceae bacterium]|nr:glycosyltransferase [Desulfovibrionaceae bacterium]